MSAIKHPSAVLQDYWSTLCVEKWEEVKIETCTAWIRIQIVNICNSDNTLEPAITSLMFIVANMVLLGIPRCHLLQCFCISLYIGVTTSSNYTETEKVKSNFYSDTPFEQTGQKDFLSDGILIAKAKLLGSFVKNELAKGELGSDVMQVS